MSDQTIRLVVAAVLLLHGLGHGGALPRMTRESVWILNQSRIKSRFSKIADSLRSYGISYEE